MTPRFLSTESTASSRLVSLLSHVATILRKLASDRGRFLGMSRKRRITVSASECAAGAGFLPLTPDCGGAWEGAATSVVAGGVFKSGGSTMKVSFLLFFPAGVPFGFVEDCVLALVAVDREEEPGFGCCAAT
ncbi:MAG: hypothetical protein ABS98_17150 [Lysobacteraceae bacterium SCN 69-48]|nr:MAG: hypothetical protein ABS98_17150 [Xanthomonadaceae bacterium SCN 69-48]